MIDKIISYLNQRLEEIPELRKKSSSLNNPEFDYWIQNVITACGRISEGHKKKAEAITFYPMITFGGDNSRSENTSYHTGLNTTESFIKSVIEELNVWGSPNDTGKDAEEKTKATPHMNIYLTMSQSQSQQIIQSINLDDYDDETRKKVELLFQELQKKDKNKKNIAEIIKWLADKGIDVLISILLNQAGATK